VEDRRKGKKYEQAVVISNDTDLLKRPASDRREYVAQ